MRPIDAPDRCGWPMPRQPEIGANQMNVLSLAWRAFIVGCVLFACCAGQDCTTLAESSLLASECDSHSANATPDPAATSATPGAQPVATAPGHAEAGKTADCDAKAGLSVQIELPGTDDSRVLNYDNFFRVVLTNHSDRAMRIWRPRTENGYYQLSFCFKNLRSGETVVASKRRIDDRKFWSLSDNGNDSGSATQEIQPNRSLTVEVDFSDFAWGEREWTGLPCANSDDRFAISAQFESTIPNDTLGEPVWSGKIQSSPVSARFVAAKLKTAGDYLRSGLPGAAIALMTADPTLISATDSNWYSPLHHAAHSGDVVLVMWLLDHGANVNSGARDGFTPLHLANDERVVELILQKHPQLDWHFSGDPNPLQRAAANFASAKRPNEREKWRRIVKRYLDAGADYDMTTAIHLDDLRRVQEILRETPDDAEDFQNHSPLRTAAALGRLEICRYLIDKHHVDVNDFKRGHGYPIVKDALPHPQVVKLLIQSGADLKTRVTWRGDKSGIWFIDDNATALHYAAADGVPETITLLIDSGVDIFAATNDPVTKGAQQTTLEIAAIFGKADNAGAIVSHPMFDTADPQMRQAVLDKSLRIAALYIGLGDGTQSAQLVKLLLDKHANPNGDEPGGSLMPLLAAQIHPTAESKNNQIKQIVALLREHAVPVDLFSAVAIGDEPEVARLLEQHPELANTRGPDGYPALHLAVGMDFKHIVAMLLRAGCDIELRNQSKHTGGVGATALDCAASWGRHEIAKLLIDAGANVNARTDRKSTPLHEATRAGHVRMTRLLLENGADPDARDNHNETPLDEGRQRNGVHSNAPEIEAIFREFQQSHQE
jgi:ankyrin repeat protein